ncbi:MAG TPA: GBS Bsp-like repeat-containing protein [Candidatus Dorea intestinavium]|nr:GBS Bsp-like repeat-containing protein [Candidatus Dorea intestinavium]
MKKRSILAIVLSITMLIPTNLALASETSLESPETKEITTTEQAIEQTENLESEETTDIENVQIPQDNQDLNTNQNPENTQTPEETEASEEETEVEDFQVPKENKPSEEVEDKENSQKTEEGLEDASNVPAEASELQAEPVKADLLVAATPNQKSFKVTVPDELVPQSSKKVMVAIWSTTKGQDDLCWYTTTKEAEGYTMSVDLKNHKSLGKFEIHAYAIGQKDENIFIKSSSYRLESPTVGSVSIQGKNTNGFQVVVADIGNGGLMKELMIPVWCDDNQQDLVWYTPTYKNGKYYLDVNVKNHKYHTGKYKVDVWIKNSVNEMNCVKSLKEEISANIGKLSVVEKANQDAIYTASLKGATYPGGIKKVMFAVWSKDKGQDDIIWYNTTKRGDNYDCDINLMKHKSLGTYEIHAYIWTQLNENRFLQKSTFETAKPQIGNVTIGKANIKKGTFQVEITNLKNTSAIKEVLVPVWSTKNQNDLVWYRAKKKSANNYELTVDIKNHKYNEGNYRVDVYVHDIIGGMTSKNCGTFKLSSSNEGVSASNVENKDTNYQIKLKNPAIAGGANSVLFAVWSDKGGQDDLHWYRANKNGNDYSYNVQIKNHKTEGNYRVDVYAEKPNKAMVLLGKTNFKVSAKPSYSSIKAENISGEKGTFDVIIKGINSPSGVSKVLVPIWCADNQSDLVWYVATKDKNGNYKVSVNINSHKNHFGNYKIDVYTVMGNGIQAFTGKTTAKIQALNYVTVKDVGNGNYEITISNPKGGNASKVLFPTWSEKNGQDDLVWYTGSNKGNNVWSAIISGKNHKNGGKFITDIYATINGKQTAVKRTTYEVPESAIMSEAERRVDNGANMVLNNSNWELHKAYLWLVNNIRYKTLPIHVTPPAGYTREQWYAVMGYEQRTGNCFVYAAAFANIARKLGYDAQYLEGQVAVAGGRYDRHGWTKITIDGASYYCDPQLQMRLGLNFYMQPVGNTLVNYY